MATLVSAARAWENHVYYLAVNRVGERGRLPLHRAEFGRGLPRRRAALGRRRARKRSSRSRSTRQRPRQKRVVHCAGVYEIDRVNWRRPEMYGPLTANPGTFTGHFNK